MSNENLSPGVKIAGRWRIIAPHEDFAGSSFRVQDEDGDDAELIILDGAYELPVPAETLDSLDHENIISFGEFGEWRDHKYLVRELVMGQRIKDRLSRDGRLGYDQALGIGCQLCLASTEAAKAGIDYLGFHPGTVRVTPDGFVKIDPLRLEIPEDDRSYMSPEERAGGQPTRQSDVFRIALLIREMLIGDVGRDAKGCPQAVTLSEVRSDLPEALGWVIEAAMSTRAGDRHQNAEALLDELHPLLMKPPRTAAEGPEKWYEGKRFWLYTAITLGLILIILSFITGMFPFPLKG